MMINMKHLLTLTAALTLISGAAQANQNEPSLEVSPIISLDDKDDFISIPLDTTLVVKDMPIIDRELSEEFDTDYTTKVRYDLLGNVDADFGLIKNRKVSSRYRVKSGAQPRGRYFKAPKSKIGAGISSKF